MEKNQIRKKVFLTRKNGTFTIGVVHMYS